MSYRGHDGAIHLTKAERIALAEELATRDAARSAGNGLTVKRRLPYRPPNDTSEAARARATAAWGFDPGRPVLSRWLWVFVVKAR